MNHPYEVIPGPRGSIRTKCPACNHTFELQVEGVRRIPYFESFEKLLEDKERFWNHVQRSPESTGCWLWLRGMNSDGYGNVAFSKPRRQTLLAHRVAYILFVGPIKDRALILHSCDTPLCVRPDHLKQGDQSQNQRQRRAKERAANPI
jgi:hypothetical protein